MAIENGTGKAGGVCLTQRDAELVLWVLTHLDEEPTDEQLDSLHELRAKLAVLVGFEE